MRLHEATQRLVGTLTDIDHARRGLQEAARIEARLEEWSQALGALQSAQRQADWLNISLDDVHSFNEPSAHMQQLAQVAAERLSANRNVEDLLSEDLWIRLLQTVKSAMRAVKNEVASAWASLAQEFRALTPYRQLHATVAPLPQNRTLLEAYRSQYEDGARLANLPEPRSGDDQTRIREIVANCKQIVTQLTYDAPAEVGEFYRSINAGTASLEHVTPEVLAWLSSNDNLRNYVVRSSGA